jgi:hypothetical protein
MNINYNDSLAKFRYFQFVFDMLNINYYYYYYYHHFLSQVFFLPWYFSS